VSRGFKSRTRLQLRPWSVHFDQALEQWIDIVVVERDRNFIIALRRHDRIDCGASTRLIRNQSAAFECGPSLLQRIEFDAKLAGNLRSGLAAMPKLDQLFVADFHALPIDILYSRDGLRAPKFTFAQAIANSKVLFDAAKRAGVRRVVHISITNPDRRSSLPYFRGKAELEDHLKSTGMSYAILRPAVLFGKEDILINNIAWALRYLPLFGIYGDGRYRLQPIHVDDLAAAVLECIAGKADETVDAIGPETFRYRDMVEMIAREIGSRALIVSMPPMVAYQSVRVLGWLVGDVITTPDEVKGLMHERLYVDSPPLGRTKLSDWVRAFQGRL
jgi:hypothetical protein